MKDTDQIAAEAAKQICGNYPATPTADECATIIKAAIEKAFSKEKSRAAHASEQEVGTCTCDYFPVGRVTDDSCPIHGAAHASEADG